MKARIIQLENELEQSESEHAAKRARKTPNLTNEAGPSSSKAAAATAKTEEKKRRLILKRIFDQRVLTLKKGCKSDTCKFQGSPKTVKVDDVIDYDDFQAIFRPGEIGTLIQPTPENKPKSTVTIIHYNSAQVSALFGDEMKELKGNMWTIGGAPYFSKSVKRGQCTVVVDGAQLNYAKNGMKCTIKFDVRQQDGEYDEYDSDSDNMFMRRGWLRY
ncbi:hypothetical protein PUNSTDRAFT_86963 [Punctularia strigosozonata HHB-11173 SS5]|uniref:uncharacterized protein n=1 Tax=Punctularia strigosozonata (strain HHB-11173) TaxID=741275 RepID=UPI00044168B0|nr:uncharacterized protein PUNSTDRAFT_86963 [Punctularia strigosozonata HHB-11173 SS5]EIN08891.1 hypothetical protein PUNSTDRAFT_86963 [Punctularia strigosozonata HHB-11173 SS5]